MSIFWGYYGGVDSSSARADAAAARGDARSARTDAHAMELRLERAMLACEAMWSLVRDKLGVTDVQLIERMNDIDLSDGQLDGKVRKQPVACPKCRRTISPRLPQCMYCGQAIVHDPFA